MAASMGPPPVVLCFSLRVQLFSPNGYGAGNKPIRCFRVVTSPDVTIREFCEEASRIHEINYGEPLAIKKCQDDQAFDVTQSEIVGHLFTSGSTILVIQASSHTESIRDSVPPDSALRYNPALLSGQRNKRNRGSSVKANGALSPAFSSNKRQKLSDNGPDHPIPSLERDFESSQGEHNATIIPNSQQSTGRPRDIGDEIRDSLSPLPQLALPHSVNIEKRPTDERHDKPAATNRTNVLSDIAHGSPSHPTTPTSASARSKGASYHIERATGPGVPVLTGAASPVSADRQLPPPSRSTLTNKSKLSSPVTVNGKPSPKSRSEKSVYDVDEVESDNTSSSAILDRTKASLKVRKSPVSGLSVQERRDKINTPPNGNRHNSGGGDQVSSPKLPLTPSSKQREEKQQQLDDARKAPVASAEAAKQRMRETSEQKRREADEARKADRAKSAGLARLKKEEKERMAAEKRATSYAKAARLEKERVEKIEREKKAEEERQAEKRAEDAQIKKTKEQAENLEREKKARIDEQKQEEERARNEKAKAKAKANEAKGEAERRRKEEEQNRKSEPTAAEILKKSKKKTQAEPKTMERKLSSASVESSRSGSHTSQFPIPRPQSSTPFIPSGRKSALKASQAALAFSPMPKESPSESSITSSQITPSTRRVSFNLEVTPLRPSSSRRSSKLQTAVPPERQSQTPILPPSIKLSNERPTHTLPPRMTTPITPPTSITPRVTVKSASPAVIASKENETARSSITKGKPKAVETTPALHSRLDTSSKGSNSDQTTSDDLNPSKNFNTPIRPNTLSPKIASKPEPALKDKADEELDEDVDMGSRQSTPPDIRSPVVFNHHPAALTRVPTLELSKATDVAEDEAEIQSLSDASSSDDGSNESSEGHDENDDEDDVEDGNEDEEMDDVEYEGDDASAIKAPQSSLDLSLPQISSQHTVSGGKSNLRTGRLSPGLSDKESTTQDAIDYQLTSSIVEARTSTPHTTIQNRNKTESPSNLPSSQRPKFKIGASLRDLNAAQGMAGRSSPAIGQRVVNRNRTIKPLGVEESGSQSESDSADDSDLDSDGEEINAKAFDSRLSQAQSIPLPASDDDSSGDSDSEEEYRDNMKNKLVADLARMVQKTSSPKRPQSSSSQPQGSKDKSRIAGRDIVKAEKKKRDKMYLTGYTFSQVR